MLPIEIGIKKYCFIDDDDAEAAEAAEAAVNNIVSVKTTKIAH
jgi:hypothetical protein